MKDHKAGSHTIWNCKCHVVWVTKYRYAVLGGDMGVNRDHVHMLIGIPPKLSVSKAVQYLKGRSSHKLLSEYDSLRKRYWGQHLWARGYRVASSGNVTDDIWKKYIEDQQPKEPEL